MRTNTEKKSARFAVADHVSWNSEAGKVIGVIIAVHEKDFLVNGYTHHASPEQPQYAIRSDKTSHVAYHKGDVLRRLDNEDTMA